MTIRRFALYALSATLTAAVLATAPLVAHHSSAPFYDATKSAEAQGPVTKLLLRNPHSFLYFASEANGKKVEWQVELGPAASLTRTGWTTETLKPGTIVKVVGQPSRAEGSYGMCCAKVTRPDGSPIQPGGRVMEEQQPPR